jgi:hypothetical protein
MRFKIGILRRAHVLLRILVAIGVAGVTLIGTQSAKAQTMTIGGGSDFGSSTTIDLAPGTRLDPFHFLFVANPSSVSFPVEWVGSAPKGLTLTPEVRNFILAPGDTRRVHFKIEVARDVLPGEYHVVAQLRRGDAPVPRQGEVVEVPAIAVDLLVRVAGATGTLRVTAMDKLSGSPVAGSIAILRLESGREPFQIGQEDNASRYETRVLPGRFEVRYSFADRVLASESVTVSAGRVTEVVLQVSSVSFAVADFVEHRSEGQIVYVDLIASVANSLQPMLDARLSVSVDRDGHSLETIPLGSAISLATGLTDQKARYVPEGGWRPGRYTFTFLLEAGKSKLTQTVGRKLTISDQSARPWVWLLVAAIVGTMTAVLAAKRRRTRANRRGASQVRLRRSEGERRSMSELKTRR